ncbi:hypothetical protein EIP91_007670 [Steccherinum ochraceum]|uniref:F-box domain-containing protein n=1 Tax=Steccherinum ochraceum TaxID=92696 RepID=A0A4R0R3X9_9APHY|nr:hypothetical protein EIP91_007670 [Steccherinum ochraceum]
MPCLSSRAIILRPPEQAIQAESHIVSSLQFTPYPGPTELSSGCVLPRSSISRVPNELLAEIFRILRAQPSENSSWVRILRVCKHWFAVAATLSDLWTRVSSKQSVQSISRFLSYSKSRPLQVDIYPKEDSSATLFAIGAEIDRMQTLSATFSRCYDFHVAICFIFSRLPSLQDVSMEIIHPYPLANPRIFPLDKCCALQSLRLVNIDAAFESGTLSQLTKLTLENVKGLPSLATLVEILRAAPGLENLELSGGCPIELLFEDATPVTYLPVHLPKLKRMRLRSEPELPRALFTILSTPPDADIMIYLPVVSLHGVSRTLFLEALPPIESLSNIGGLARINSLSLRFHGPTPSLMGFCIDSAGCQPLFALMVVETAYPPTKTPTQEIVHGITSAIEILGLDERVVSLDILGPEEDPSAEKFDVSCLIFALPKLTGLWLRQSGLPSVLSALLDEWMDDDGDCGVVCPDLKEMQWQDMRFDDELVVNVMDCLERRREMGVTLLERLSIVGSRNRGLRDEYVNMLERVARKLSYDE